MLTLFHIGLLAAAAMALAWLVLAIADLLTLLWPVTPWTVL